MTSCARSITFRVELTAQADHDLNDILEWLLAQHAGEAGLRWFLNLESARNSLSELPHRYSLAPESAEFPFEVRQLIYRRKPHFYRMLLTVDTDTVIILHVRHGRRLPLGS